MAAHLNKLGDQQPSQPEAPPRNHRNVKHSQSAVNNNNIAPSSTSNHASNAAGSAAVDTAVVDSDSDSEQEDGGRVRNDGTLLASDPPKPL